MEKKYLLGKGQGEFLQGLFAFCHLLTHYWALFKQKQASLLCSWIIKRYSLKYIKHTTVKNCQAVCESKTNKSNQGYPIGQNLLLKLMEISSLKAGIGFIACNLSLWLENTSFSRLCKCFLRTSQTGTKQPKKTHVLLKSLLSLYADDSYLFWNIIKPTECFRQLEKNYWNMSNFTMNPEKIK